MASRQADRAVYLVTAYRWGHTNLHSYVVYCGPSANAADNAARLEPEERGGKYGAIVERYTDGQDRNFVAYYPSIYGEEKPTRNWRTDMFEALGHILDDYVGGTVWVPNEDNVLKPTNVTPDPIVVARVNQKRRFYEKMEELAAQGMAARSGETGTGSTEGNSPVPEGNAPCA